MTRLTPQLSLVLDQCPPEVGGWLEPGSRLVIRDRERFSGEHYYCEDWPRFLERLRESGFVAAGPTETPPFEFVLVETDEGTRISYWCYRTLINSLRIGGPRESV